MMPFSVPDAFVVHVHGLNDRACNDLVVLVTLSNDFLDRKLSSLGVLGGPAALRKDDDQAARGLDGEADVEVFAFPPDYEFVSTWLHIYDDNLGVLREGEGASV